MLAYALISTDNFGCSVLIEYVVTISILGSHSEKQTVTIVNSKTNNGKGQHVSDFIGKDARIRLRAWR